FKIDRTGTDEYSWYVNPGLTTQRPTRDGPLVLVSMKNSEASIEQKNYLRGYVQSFDNALYSANYRDPVSGYNAWIDRGSWVDHHWLNMVTKNPDALRLSAYFHKDRLGKINAGPIWDFDRTLFSYDGRDSDPVGWNGSGDATDYFNLDWWGRLFTDADFKQAWADRWIELRRGAFATINLHAIVNAMAAEIGPDAALRNYTRWNIFPDSSRGGTFSGETSALKNWLTSRMSWIDTQIRTTPSISRATGVVTAGTTVTLSGSGGTIYYTLNGQDPRAAGGGIVGTAYTGAVTINATTVLTTRIRFSDGTWSGPASAVYLVNEVFAAAGDIAITELNYNPLSATGAEASSSPFVGGDDFEFIEIHNVGTRRVNLFGVTFAEGFPFQSLTLPAFTLNQGDYVLVVKNKTAFTLRYGSGVTPRIVGEWSTGSLGNGGEQIRLLARDSSVIQDFTFSDAGAWPGRADGKGATLEYVGASFTTAALNLGTNWRASSEFHGTPAAPGTGPEESVVINEVLSHASSPFVQAIELRNNTASPIDVGGWYLSNAGAPEDLDSFRQFRIAAGTTIPAGGYLVFDERNFNPNGAWNPSAGVPGPGEFSFSLYRDNDAWLIRSDDAGKPTRLVNRVEFGPARLGETWGRWPNGTGSLYPLVQQTLFDSASATTPKATLGAINSAPRVGPLLVSEIQHSPATGSVELEFIEVRNTGSTAQSLANWRLRGDADFDFTSQSLQPGGLLVVVPFAPTDTARANAFRSAYQIAATVPLAGPWDVGNRLDPSGSVVLYRAEAEPAGEPGFIPRTTEDVVNYSIASPWPFPSTPGLSLNRRGTTTAGDFATSWKYDVPTPGGVGVSYAAWKAFFFPAGGAGTGDAEDFDGDGSGNYLEYIRITNPRVADDQVSLLPTLVRQNGQGAVNYIFTFNRPLDRPGTTYLVEQSGDLISWAPAQDTLVSVAADTETRQVVVSAGIDGPPQLFFRLRTTNQ
ncbi:MAG TPA: lamin tail domain-containing protein, partial [Chthoniobacteraceae bacterium]